MKSVLSTVLLVACLVACNRHVAVEPAELARLAPPPPLPKADAVRDLDGELVEMGGEFDAIVHTTRGDYDFQRPVIAWLTPGVLVISGANQPPVAVPLAEIQDVELKQFSQGRTLAVVVPISVAALIVILFAGTDVGH